jgi:hypothetical protein
VLFFVFLLLKRSLANYCALGALYLGLARSHGHPNLLNSDYLQRVKHDENFQAILYMAVVFWLGQVNFVLYVPLMMHALLESGETLEAYLSR